MSNFFAEFNTLLFLWLTLIMVPSSLVHLWLVPVVLVSLKCPLFKLFGVWFEFPNYSREYLLLLVVGTWRLPEMMTINSWLGLFWYIQVFQTSKKPEVQMLVNNALGLFPHPPPAPLHYQACVYWVLNFCSYSWKIFCWQLTVQVSGTQISLHSLSGG